MAATVKNIKSDTTTSGLSNQVETLRSELSELTQTISDMGKAKGNEALSTVKSKAADALNTVEDQTETARLHAMELQDQATDFIKKQPVMALGIAAGVGVLVGILSARK